MPDDAPSRADPDDPDDPAAPAAPALALESWVVETIVGREVILPTGDTLPRGEFFDRAWALLDGIGLEGIFEGSVDVAEAFAEGLADTALVLDAAAAPPRDWVERRRLVDAAFWFPSEHAAREGAARLVRAVGCSVAAIRRERRRDWEADARAAFVPVDVPGFGTVVPPWHTDAADARPGTTLVIDPGIGFGTGLHPTTRQCLAAIAALLERHPDPRTARVLDYGAGSGILAIAAALRGVTAVEAVEIDDRVHDAIRANARSNGVADRIAVVATPATGADRDLVVANIVAAVLLDRAADLVGRLRPGGTIVLAGLREDDVAAVVARYEALGVTRSARGATEGWSCLWFSAPAAAT